MKTFLVLYYSKTGNSHFVAEQVAKTLKGDLQEIKAPINMVGVLFLLSALKIAIRTNVSVKELRKYQQVVVLGPVWGGTLIAPLKNVLKKCVKAAVPIHFAVTCETSEADKDSKYGYGSVLQEARKIGGSLLKTTAAFSTDWVRRADQPETINMAKKTKFHADNFTGEIKRRLDDFINHIRK